MKNRFSALIATMLVASSLTTTVVGVTTQLSASANSTACASTDSSHFTVSTIQDSGPGSLRQALANAEQANGGTICFTPDLGTITFGSGIDYTGTGSLTLEGNGATLDGGSSTNLLRFHGVRSGSRPPWTWTALPLIIEDLKLSHASIGDDGAALWMSAVDATISDSSFLDNHATGRQVGGAIATYPQSSSSLVGEPSIVGSLTISGSSFTNNSDACLNCGGDGGGAIMISGGSSDVPTVIRNSSFVGNTSSGPGAAVNAAYPGALIVLDSTFDSNVSSGGNFNQGGAIYSEGTLDVGFSTFTSNQADTGSAIANITGKFYANIFSKPLGTATLCSKGATSSSYNFANETANSCGLLGTGDSSIDANDPGLGSLSTGPRGLQWMAPGSALLGTIPSLPCPDPYVDLAQQIDEVGSPRPAVGGRGCTPGAIEPAKPGTPRRVKTTTSGTSLTVRWKAPKADGRAAITGYKVKVSPGSFHCRATTVRQCSFSGINPSTHYSVKVWAKNAVGKGAAGTFPASRPVPATPTNVVATPGDGLASVAFTGSSGATSYTVTSYPDGTIATGTLSPIVVSGLSNGTVERFRVTATNASGTSNLSEASESVVINIVLAAPTNVQASPGSGSATISFALSSNATSYTVTVSPGGGTVTGSSSPIIFSGLPDASYTFTVTAKNGTATSSPSLASGTVVIGGG